MFTRAQYSSLLILAALGPVAATSTELAAIPPASNSTQTAAHSSHQAQASDTYANLPLSFEANRGQADPGVKFLSRGNGYSLMLTDREAVLVLGKSKQDLIRMKLAGVSDLPGAKADGLKAIGEDELPGKVNYFIGNDPAKWHAGLPTFAKVRYTSVYPGVDLLYYGNQGRLEYDFVVAPGASASAIRLQFTGEKRLQIAANGDLLLQGVHGSAIFHKPVVYQEKDGKRQPVIAGFHLEAKNTVGFVLGNFDHGRPLVIDPVLIYSTYLGGSGIAGHGDQGNAIAVDSTGNAYVVGTTYSANFPVTGSSYQAQNLGASSSNSTVFVTKLNATGTALVYSTYLGGSGDDFGYGIALDSANNAYITGTTYSQDFPVTCGAIQTLSFSAANGASTAFVTKLNPSGSALAYSTYLGGTGNDARPSQGDVAQAIMVDPSGNAYVTGYTWSSDFPTTNGAFQTQFAGGASTSNGFVTKVNSGGTALAYSTFLGGNGSTGTGDFANGIALDSSGDVYVTGSTGSANFPVTSGALQPELAGNSNAFVTELNPSGAAAIYSTFLGGSTGDSGQAIALDSQGSVYVAGTTTSSNFPLTANVLEGSGLEDLQTLVMYAPLGFLSKLNQDRTGLAYSTFVEGHDTTVTALAVDSTGNAYLTGTAATQGAGGFTGFQETPDGLAVPASTGTSGFLVKLDSAAATLSYATLLGGSSNDGTVALALDTSGNAYVTGYAASTDFPTTTGAYQKTNNGAALNSSNAFVGKFALAAEANKSAYVTPPAGLLPTSFTIVFEDMVPGDDWAQYVGLVLNSAVPGPPPTGTVTLNGSGGQGTANVSGNWSGASAEMDIWAYMAINGPDWSASYSGDSVYQPSTTTGVAQYPSCYPTTCCNPVCESQFKPASPDRSKSGHARSASDAEAKAASSSWKPELSTSPGPKFTPPAMIWDPNRNQTVSPLSSPGCSLPALTVTVNSASRLYGHANPSFSYTVSGLLNGDTVTVATQSAASLTSPVGTYPATAVVRGTALAKYNLVLNDATLTVTPAPLTVTVIRNYKVYGGPNPTFGYAVSGLLNGDTVTVVTSSAATSATPVGTYPATATVSGAALSNYTLTAVDGTLRIDPATLYVSAKGSRVTYGQASPPTAFGLIGFVNGDTASVVTGLPVLTTAVPMNASTPVGNYPIAVAAGTLSAANYTIKPYIYNGDVEVIPAHLTVTARDAYQLVRATPGGLSFVFSGFVNGETASVVSGAPVLTTEATASSPAGSYSIIPAVGTLATANYTFGFADGKLNIFAPIDIGSSAVGTATPYNFSFPSGPANPIGSTTVLTAGDQKPELSGATIACSGTTCKAALTFTPHAPGLWIGAYQLFDQNSPANLLVSIPVYGDGTGPQMLFDPGTPTVVQPTGSVTFGGPAGVACDANGVLYIADAAGNQIVKASGSAITVVALPSITLKSPDGIALDGAGNLYIADEGNNRIVELSPSGAAKVLSLASLTLSKPHGLAIDRNGSLNIADTGNKRIVQVTAGGTVSVLSTGSLTLSEPEGLAVDVAGDLLIADTGNNRIVILTSAGAASVVATGTSALSSPTGVAIDPAGTLYITETGSNRVIEVSSTETQIVLASTGLNGPRGLALDHSGVLYIPDTGNKRVLELVRYTDPTLSFATTVSGKESKDSPKLVTLRNIGNTPLAIATITYPADFPEDPSGQATDCKSTTNLPIAGHCALTIDFKPAASSKSTSIAPKESVQVTTDTLNAVGNEQSITVEGTETLP